jgi:hypothetical protein
MSNYLLRVLIAFDVLLMAVLGGRRNETLSAASWSLEQDGKLAGRIFRPLIDWLFSWLQANHCREAWESENTNQHPADAGFFTTEGK